MSSFKEFIDLTLSITDRDLLEDFLVGITTDKERAELSKRIEIIKMLLDEVPQKKIAGSLGVGVATVTRGSKELSKGRFTILQDSRL